MYFFVKPQRLVTSLFQVNLEHDTCGSLQVLELSC